MIAELGLKYRIHWGLLRGVDIPIRRLLHCRGYGVASRVLARVLGDKTVTVRVLGRAYWLSFVLSQKLYEKEFFPFLSHLAQYRCGFVDGGANIGWWSVIAEKFFGWPSVAIEAGQGLMPVLEANRRTNGGHFRILNRILWRADGEKLPFRFDPLRHAEGSVDLEAAGHPQVSDEVETVSLDTVIFEHLETLEFHPDLIIVKLDIEGAEGMALEGAVRALGSRDMLLLYEDHGRDLACSATAAMLAR
jgi:FkbM family methyltransferase